MSSICARVSLLGIFLFLLGTANSLTLECGDRCGTAASPCGTLETEPPSALDGKLQQSLRTPETVQTVTANICFPHTGPARFGPLPGSRHFHAEIPVALRPCTATPDQGFAAHAGW